MMERINGISKAMRNRRRRRREKAIVQLAGDSGLRTAATKRLKRKNRYWMSRLRGRKNLERPPLYEKRGELPMGGPIVRFLLQILGAREKTDRAKRMRGESE